MSKDYTIYTQSLEIESLKKENERYREVLEFYLSKNNWDEGLVYLDGGYKAHEALEGDPHD